MALAATALVLISIITHGAAQCATSNHPKRLRQLANEIGVLHEHKLAADYATGVLSDVLHESGLSNDHDDHDGHGRQHETPNADCALYILTGTMFGRGTPSNRTETPGTAVASGAVAGTTTLSRVFANTGCTVKLFTDAAPADTATGELESHVGTATDKFFTVTAANNGALSYTCVCT